MKAKLLAIGLLLATPAAAQDYGSTYDWQSGNNYQWNSNPYSGTTVYGNNLNTGSSWNTRIDPQGNMTGTDSQGNYWNYNNSTGTYMNYGTGKFCVGEGAARVCN